jgi:hypothetical protein
MNFMTVRYAIKVYLGSMSLTNEQGIEQVPFLHRKSVNDLLESDDLIILTKQLLTQKIKEEFVKKRDCIRWIDDYGFDCANVDITNFLASLSAVESDNKKWQEERSLGEKPVTPYKVYLDKVTLKKGTVLFNLEQLQKVRDIVRISQLEAYAWLGSLEELLESALPVYMQQGIEQKG